LLVYLPDGRIGGYRFRAIEPAPQRQAVRVLYCNSKDEADRIGSAGFSYLLRLQLKPQFKELLKYTKLSFTAPSARWLSASFGSQAPVREAVLDFVVKAVIGETFPQLQSAETFNSHVEQLKHQNLPEFGRQVIDRIMALLRLRAEVSTQINKFEQLSRKSGSRNPELFSDLRDQLGIILPVDFLRTFSPDDLDHGNRYLKSLAIRSERAYHNPQKDLQKREAISPYQKKLKRYLENKKELNRECRNRLAAFEQILNEFRVSLFSPEIKTIIPVSEKKIKHAWKDFISVC
ncbi:MAG: DUF3418 domain-containing protein, partial [Desulfofustis sp.]